METAVWQALGGCEGWAGRGRRIFTPTGGCRVAAGSSGPERDRDGWLRAQGGQFWHGKGGAGVCFTPLAACRHVVIVWFCWPQMSRPISLHWERVPPCKQGPLASAEWLWLNCCWMESLEDAELSHLMSNSDSQLCFKEVHGRSDQFPPSQVTCCKVHIDPLQLNDIGVACRAPGEGALSRCSLNRDAFALVQFFIHTVFASRWKDWI